MSLTIEQVIEILNRRRHREWDDWRETSRYAPSGFSGGGKIDRGEEPMVECGDFRLRGTVFVLRLTDAVIIAQYYLDQESPIECPNCHYRESRENFISVLGSGFDIGVKNPVQPTPVTDASTDADRWPSATLKKRR